VSGWVFDVPALTDAAGGWPSEYVVALITVAAEIGQPVVVPSTVRAQAMRECVTPGQLAELDWFLARSTPIVTEEPVHGSDVPDIEAWTVKFGGDVAAAQVAVVSRRDDRVIVTSWDRKPMFTSEGLRAEDLP
jgi:hypothetical protein